MLKKKHSTSKHLPRGLEILYEDRDILVVDKPAGLLTVGTETNKFKTAYYILTVMQYGVRLWILRFGVIHKKVGPILLTKGVDESVGPGLKCGGKINENAWF